MTDDEAYDLLNSLAAKEYAAWQKGERPKALRNAPETAVNSINEGLWYAGTRHIEPELSAQGATAEQIRNAVQKQKEVLGIVEQGDLADIPNELRSEIADDLWRAFDEESANMLRRLDEKLISEITECRIDIYLNESQHRGRPHVVVTLQDGKISVSLDDPPEVLTPHGYRGERSAQKVVKKHRKRLLEIWHETRPDDQKLKN